MTALLEISDLSLAFRTEEGDSDVLDHVCLTLWPGEIVGLVGESGCGKSTVARAILGTLPINQTIVREGRILFDGADILRDSKAIRSVRGTDITFIPQDPFASLSPFFRIGTQISDLMRWHMSRIGQERRSDFGQTVEESVAAMLDAVHLPQPTALLEKYPHQLSGGQRQRIMIAMALLPQPRLIIADEPTTSLDATLQAQILGILRRLAVTQGASVLFTAHDLAAAWEICDRVIVMYAGQTAEIASRETFFSKPMHPYTRMLLASLPEPGREPAGIPGDVPDPLSPPKGCRFNPRCPRSSDLCREVRPVLTSYRAHHAVACHHPWTEPERIHV